ncbi:hypothetical protein C1O66_09695 [Paucibacter aquatile]|uniref:Glycosyltransferase 2-like domain-containing protein n=1 Tax=Kinneretia aquatilis TaxID=2070761 RepID=A0A2N8KWF6_9BURK|nr:glycosyltransferase [Paucibacter aquatile]PND37771.1 hypothetical protein C1O66_09695 [Paucibacter aquatile]
MSPQTASTSQNRQAGDKDSRVDLSICVIGHNEAPNLGACARSLERVKGYGINCETVFVDSASNDNSVEIAVALFDKVLELTASPQLNAGAARAAGTLESKGRWILYLDGDMCLRPEFDTELLYVVADKGGKNGLAGQTRNIYPDGSFDLMQLAGNQPGMPCKAFGGAVLMNRDCVIEAGNWAPNLFSNEEVELYSRLLMRGSTVVWTSTHMVDHFTPKFTATNKLLGSLIPWRSHLGKKFFGAGQATRQACRNGNIFSFMRLKPLQFSMIAAVALSAITLAISPQMAIWPMLLAFIWISVRRNTKFAINCICWTSQTIFGWVKLDLKYWPTTNNIHHPNRSRLQKPE